jgi:ATP-binding cassette subfamily B protein
VHEPLVDLTSLAWPKDQLAEALEALAQHTGLTQGYMGSVTAAPPGQQRSIWLDAVAAHLGVEAEPVRCEVAHLRQLVRGSGPALLHLPTAQPGTEYLLALVGCRRHALLLTRERVVVPVAPEQIVAALSSQIEAPIAQQIASLLERAGIPEARRIRAGQALLRERLAGVSLDVGWLLRPPLAAPLLSYARHFRVLPPIILVGILTLLIQGLSLLGWVLLGREALEGIFTRAQINAWGLLLLSAIPVQLWLTALQHQLELLLGATLKLRLLSGAFQRNPDAVRHQGAGQFLGLMIDAETFDNIALLGGFTTLSTLAQVGTALIVLGYGVEGSLHTILLLLWLLLIGGLFLIISAVDGRWFTAHREMTNELVEAMVGHRTRLAQEDRTRWHQGEDRNIAGYMRLSTRLDRLSSILTLLPRIWTIVALASLAPIVIAGTEITALAISLGGIILAQQGLNGLTNIGLQLTDALTAWRQIRPFIKGDPTPRVQLPSLITPTNLPETGRPLLTARGLVYRYRPGATPVLHGCNLRIAVGDRLLLEGPSGGGKSTLAALLAGLRTPEAGIIMLDGLDPSSMDAGGWRRRVTMAPQFHENHVFTGSFAFNLLMGRRWPPEPKDLADAEEMCAELGLSDLLDRMPAGIQQQVGETGWQLSHGERSRLFLARALLQGAPLVILDESFGALDPENLELSLTCALRRSQALLLIAHP